MTKQEKTKLRKEWAEEIKKGNLKGVLQAELTNVKAFLIKCKQVHRETKRMLSGPQRENLLTESRGLIRAASNIRGVLISAANRHGIVLK